MTNQSKTIYDQSYTQKAIHHGSMNRFIYGNNTGSRLVGNKKKRKVIGKKK